MTAGKRTVVVVADTGPLHYFVLIGQVAVLPRLFGSVAVPVTVLEEMRRPGAPGAVRALANAPPSWLTVHADPAGLSDDLRRLDPGERAAVLLVGALGAGLLLVDDRAGTAAARARGIETVGTVGVLDRAARAGLLHLPGAIAALRSTSFRYPAALFDALLAEDRARRGDGG